MLSSREILGRRPTKQGYTLFDITKTHIHFVRDLMENLVEHDLDVKSIIIPCGKAQTDWDPDGFIHGK